jgi:hypothetical protein
MDNNTKKGTPKDVFLHLLGVVTLYISVVAFISLWWQYVNFLFPDQLNYVGSGSYVYDPIRWATSALIVVFPVYILLCWLIGRDFRDDPEKREIRVRKWLLYFTLFISAITIIIDLITLIYNFLQGDLTIQFFLKVAVILIIAAAVFGYYIWDIRHKEKKSAKPRLVAWITSVVILASIIYGFFLIGSPATQRARRFDDQRVSDLEQIESDVITYWQQKNVLPLNSTDLQNMFSVLPTDPESKLPYEYNLNGTLRFSLCADFKTSDISQTSRYQAVPQPFTGPAYSPYQENWSHDKGHVCFDRKIDPSLYKLNNGVPVPVPLKY